MASNTYGAIKLSTAEDVGAVLKKKTGSADGYKPKEWADTINLMGLLPIRTASGSIAHFTDGADDVPLKSLTATITPKQEGSGTPSPSNPRPISGASSVGVNVTGANVWDEQWELGDINSTTGEKTPSNYSIRSKNFIPCKPETAYYKYIGNSKANCIYYYDINQNFLSRDTNGNSTSRVITTPTGCYYMKFATYSTYGTTYLDDMAINYPSTDTNYHAYTGTTYTIDLGQEIMGGTADVVGGVGSKNKTARVLNGTEAWFLVSSGEYTTVFALGAAMSVVDQNDQICSHFNFNSQANAVSQSRANTFVQGTSGNLFIQVSNDLATTVEGFKSWLASEYANGTPVTYVAKTTPTEYTFTGQPINSYLGVNNVWTDSGEVLDVEYRADMNLLIAELGG